MRITEPYTIFLRTLSSGKQVYYYQFRNENGQRSNPKSTGCTKLSQAKRFCQQLYNNGEMVTDSTMKFSAFASGFFDDTSPYVKWKRVNNKTVTENTLQRYRQLLKFQILPYFGNIPLNKITTATVKEWIVWLSESWSAKTSNNAQTVLNIILKQAFEKNLISHVPSKDLSFRKTEKKERKLLSIDEIHDIYHSESWNDEQRRQMFLVAVCTGMRIGEVVALRKGDLHEDFIDLKHSYNDKFGLGETKTKQARYIPIPKGLMNDVSTEWVFQDIDKPVTAHKFYKRFIIVCASLGIDTKERGITVHSLRNFFVSYLQSCNVPEPKIRAVVGHADITMTDLYTYWQPEMFPEIYQAQERLLGEIK